MRLETLEVKNFCGIKAFSFNSYKRNVCISGKNGTGKSTLKNAIHWLMQDCDSNFKSFNPKPLNEDGSDKNHLETVVEAVFDEVTLKKVFAEVWKKKRGSLKKHFSGHKSTYFIDDVPVSEAEYKAKIKELIGPDEAFRVLLDPYYLPDVMAWQKRREILLGLSGDVNNEDVFKANPKLKPLREKMGDYSTADYMKMLNASLLGINKEIESIPARIDEISLMTPDISELDLAQLKAIRDKVKAHASANKKKIKELKEKSTLSEKERVLADAEKDLQIIKQAESIKENERVNKIRQLQHDIGDKVSISRNRAAAIKENTERLDACNADIERSEIQIQELSKLEFPGSCETCETCGQPYPVELAKKQFSERLDEKIKSLKLYILDRQDFATTFKKEIEADKEDLLDHDALMVQWGELEKELTDNIGLPGEEELALNSRVIVLEKEIRELKEADNSDEIESLKAANRELEQTFIQVTADIAKFKTVSELSGRLNELTQQETTLSMKYEEIELEKFMLEEFIRARVNLLNDKVIKALGIDGLAVAMFKSQINGGLKEICEFTFEGVPFQRVNRSQQIIIGLKLIEVMSKFYGVELPVLVDNSESCNSIPDFTFQKIELKVTNDTKLTVEVEK